MKETFPVLGMSCASCASSIEKILQSQAGVSQAVVNYGAKTVILDFDTTLTTLPTLQNTLKQAGFTLLSPHEIQKKSLDFRQKAELKTLRIQFLLAFPLSIFVMFSKHHWLTFGLTLTVLFFAGKRFFINAWKQAKFGHANMDTLIALSTSIAFVWSFLGSLGLHAVMYYESVVMIISFILLGKLLEENAKKKAGDAIQQLMDMQAKYVTIIKNGEEKQVPLAEVKVFDRVLIRPAEKISIDGQVFQGNSNVDESMLSGEPLPMYKTKKDQVFAGTINQEGSLKVLVQKVGSETLLGQIIQTVTQAQNSKAPVQKLVDRIAGIFVPVVILIAVFTFLCWILIGGKVFLPQGLLASISVLVVACPCALGLATPIAMIVGMGKAAKTGILIKDAEHLGKAKHLDTIILDKTGTITQGKFTLSKIIWTDKYDNHQTLEAIIKSIEKQSEHPLSATIVDYFAESPSLDIDDFQSHTGMGVSANYQNQKFFLGNALLMNTHQVPLSENFKVNQGVDSTQTKVYFANENQILAIIYLEDTIKQTSKQAIKSLQKMGLELIMLTGDNSETAQKVAKNVGITRFEAELLPHEKAKYLQKLQQSGKRVAMVGDGINDAEALALADISVAMGKGTDIAKEVAGITLIHSDLSLLSKAIQLSRLTSHNIKQNLFWAFFYNLLALPLAAGVFYPINGFMLSPMVASAAMALSSISVVGNSLRIKWKRLG